MEANYEAVQFYNMIAGQLLMTMDGTPIGLNYQSVKFIFDMYDVKNRLELFEKIRVMEKAMIESRRSK